MAILRRAHFFVSLVGIALLCPVMAPRASARGATVERSAWKRIIKVDKSGQGDYAKIQDAIDAVPSNNVDPVFIRVEPGVYKEKITVPSDKPFITLSGWKANATIITWDDSGDIFKSPTVSVLASDFVGRYLTIQVYLLLSRLPNLS